MIGECNERRVSSGRKSTYTQSDRGVHLAVWLRVYDADNTEMIYPRPKFFRSMAQYRDNGFDTASAEVVDTSLDDCLFAEGKQRLERAHPV